MGGEEGTKKCSPKGSRSLLALHRASCPPASPQRSLDLSARINRTGRGLNAVFVGHQKLFLTPTCGAWTRAPGEEGQWRPCSLPQATSITRGIMWEQHLPSQDHEGLYSCNQRRAVRGWEGWSKQQEPQKACKTPGVSREA